MTDSGRKSECDHKCHTVGLNPWVEYCPVCGCLNKNYDAKVEPPNWAKEFEP